MNDPVDRDGVSSSSDHSTHPSEQLEPQPLKQSRLISRVLAPAVRLWLRSQLEHVEDLQIEIEAGDRQLLSGGISQVHASASKAVYRGLHFSQIQITGQDIQTNLGQVLRGKPFRLLSAFPVMGVVTLSEADLNASLSAPLLANAIADFLLTLLPASVVTSSSNQAVPLSLRNVQVRLAEGMLTFEGVLPTADGDRSISIQTRLAVKNGNILKLEGFQSEIAGTSAASKPTSLAFPLGSDVHLDTLSIHQQQLHCRGRITVIP